MPDLPETRMENTERFSNRVENYVKYRPHYPVEILAYLQKETGLTQGSTLADIGSGTGILTELFLKNQYRVYGIEPNEAMRSKAEWLLKPYPDFISIAATAEDTTLLPGSVDMITAGQAFHWFDPIRSRQEFLRIAKPDGYAVLLWNERNVETDFEKAYEQLLQRYATDYSQIDHRNITPEKIQSFFDPFPVSLASFPNEQVFDLQGLKGRLLSSSYIPTEENRNYPEMIRQLTRLFEEYEKQDRVRVGYTTLVYCAQLKSGR